MKNENLLLPFFLRDGSRKIDSCWESVFKNRPRLHAKYSLQAPCCIRSLHVPCTVQFVNLPTRVWALVLYQHQIRGIYSAVSALFIWFPFLIRLFLLSKFPHFSSFYPSEGNFFHFFGVIIGSAPHPRAHSSLITVWSTHQVLLRPETEQN